MIIVLMIYVYKEETSLHSFLCLDEAENLHYVYLTFFSEVNWQIFIYIVIENDKKEIATSSSCR